MHNHLWSLITSRWTRRASADPLRQAQGGAAPRENPPLKPNYPVEPVSFQKANSRRCWPLIRDTCVPSHLIEAAFPEKETSPEQNDKTNRFKDITTVFVIGTLFMVHGNCFLWGIFLFEKVIVQRSVVNVSVFFYWTSLCLGERTMTIGFQTFPNLITGLQKPQTMPWKACHLRSQAKVLLCFFSFSSLSFHPYDLKLRIKT